MDINRSVVVPFSTMGLLMALGTAQAQTTLGTFSWQQQPYCNVITVTVVQDGATYHLDGYDDQCGDTRRASATGLAFTNPDGSIGIGLTLVTNNGGTIGGLPLHIDATLSLATVSGTWRDSTGQTGPWTFAPNGATSGAPRPLPSTGGIAANSVSTAALQAAAVTAQKLAPNAVTGAAVANGSLTMADLGDAPQIGASATASIVDLPNDPSGPPVIVRDVIVAVPAVGRIIAIGSGTFFLGPGVADTATCGVSNTLELTPPTVGVGETGTNVTLMPFAATAMFPVSPGTVTIRLLCRAAAGAVQSLRAQPHHDLRSRPVTRWLPESAAKAQQKVLLADGWQPAGPKGTEPLSSIHGRSLASGLTLPVAALASAGVERSIIRSRFAATLRACSKNDSAYVRGISSRSRRSRRRMASFGAPAWCERSTPAVVRNRSISPAMWRLMRRLLCASRRETASSPPSP